MYQIITDGSWDMGSERAARFGVEVVPYYVTMDGEHYLKEIKELDVRDFYQFMVDNPKTFPKTSLPTVQDYYDVFEKYAKQGIDIICFTLSAKFSGSYNSARNAGSMILENYPDIRVTVMDTTLATTNSSNVPMKSKTHAVFSLPLKIWTISFTAAVSANWQASQPIF